MRHPPFSCFLFVFCCSFLFLFCFCVTSVSVSASENDKYVIECDETNFQDTAIRAPAIIKFYSPYCGHCTHLAPIYAEAASLMALQHKATQFLAVNCVTQRSLCSLFSIHGYPTLKLVRPAISDTELFSLIASDESSSSKIVREMWEYTGLRNAKDMIEFVLQGWEKQKDKKQSWMYPHKDAKWLTALSNGITVFQPGPAPPAPAPVPAPAPAPAPASAAVGAGVIVVAESIDTDVQLPVLRGGEEDRALDGATQLSAIHSSNGGPSIAKLSVSPSPTTLDSTSLTHSTVTKQDLTSIFYFICVCLLILSAYWFRISWRWPWISGGSGLGGVVTVGLGEGGSKDV